MDRNCTCESSEVIECHKGGVLCTVVVNLAIWPSEGHRCYSLRSVSKASQNVMKLDRYVIDDKLRKVKRIEHDWANIVLVTHVLNRLVIKMTSSAVLVLKRNQLSVGDSCAHE